MAEEAADGLAREVTYDEAVEMLPDGEYVHAMTNPGVGVFIGCDWEREKLLEAIARYGAELTGPHATRTGHGLCFHDGTRYVFIATKESAQ